MTERPSKAWTDDDPKFAMRVRAIACRLEQGLKPAADSDPLDVAAAKLWLEYTLSQ
jgi:hypothetical protein